MATATGVAKGGGGTGSAVRKAGTSTCGRVNGGSRTGGAAASELGAFDSTRTGGGVMTGNGRGTTGSGRAAGGATNAASGGLLTTVVATIAVLVAAGRGVSMRGWVMVTGLAGGVFTAGVVTGGTTGAGELVTSGFGLGADMRVPPRVLELADLGPLVRTAGTDGTTTVGLISFVGRALVGTRGTDPGAMAGGFVAMELVWMVGIRLVTARAVTTGLVGATRVSGATGRGFAPGALDPLRVGELVGVRTKSAGLLVVGRTIGGGFNSRSN